MIQGFILREGSFVRRNVCRDIGRESRCCGGGGDCLEFVSWVVAGYCVGKNLCLQWENVELLGLVMNIYWTQE